MVEEYLQQFKEAYYEQDTGEFLDETNKYITNNVDNIALEIRHQMEEIFAEIIEVQKMIPINIACIQISLLESYVYLNEPMIQIDVYDANPIFGNILYSKKIDAAWLFTAWDGYKQRLEEHVEKMNLKRYIFPEQIRICMFESLQYIINIMVFVLKYLIAYSDKFNGYNELLKEKNFIITAGKYRDWQKTLFADMPEIDIFFNTEEKGLQFQKYRKKKYRKKIFKNLSLKHVRFSECEFLNCIFENTDLSDSVFENCILENIKTTNIIMYGVLFDGCKIMGVDFSGVKWVCKDELPEDLYRKVEFINCDSKQELPDLEVRII